MGESKGCSIDLNFNAQSEINSEFLQFKSNKNFDNLRPTTSALIVPRNSKLNVNCHHFQPALLGEWYEIRVEIVNEEEFPINDLQMEVNLVDEDLLNSLYPIYIQFNV